MAMIGVVVALAANGLSPRGLKLSRNYFPAGTNFSETVETTTNVPTPVNALTNVPPPELAISNFAAPETAGVTVVEPILTNTAVSATSETNLAAAPIATNISEAVVSDVDQTNGISRTNTTSLSALPATLIEVPRLVEKKLQGIDREQALRFFHDPRSTNGLVAFVDARSEWNYQQGHIPGAYPFDPYHPDDYLGKVVPICQAAEQVVVYCTESDCEDSEFGAVLLREAGVPNRKLFVYVGGITDWTNANLVVEIGDRNSGNLRNANQ